MGQVEQIPEKPEYKSSEVCQYTDTQPYVLRFWESEFPQLAPERRGGGQPVYTRRDIDVVLRIKRLLHDEEHTLADARRCLEQELEGAAPPEPPAAEDIAVPRPAPRKFRSTSEVGRVTAGAEPGRPVRDLGAFESVPRGRYEDAVDEIAHLRLRLKEAETQLRRSESSSQEAQQFAERQRLRCERAVERLKQLLDLVS